MNKIIKRIIAAAGTTAIAVTAFVAPSCKSEYTTYDDAEYIMFADTMAVYPVLQDGGYFKVPVVSTVTRDYDRTFAVEIVDKGSNALERKHYRLKTNTLTIKAGQTRTDIEVEGLYDNIEYADSLGFILSLVVPEQVKMPLYPTTTKVLLEKVCPFDINNYTGYCVVTSLFLYYYHPLGIYQRLAHSEVDPTDPSGRSIIIRDFLFDGYDVSLSFDTSDPLEPLVNMDNDQVISDEGSVFGISYGDDKIRAGASPVYPSYFGTCENFIELWLRVYVEDIGNPIGDVGHYYNILEWVSDEEGERLRYENGM